MRRIWAGFSLAGAGLVLSCGTVTGGAPADGGAGGAGADASAPTADAAGPGADAGSAGGGGTAGDGGAGEQAGAGGGSPALEGGVAGGAAADAAAPVGDGGMVLRGGLVTLQPTPAVGGIRILRQELSLPASTVCGGNVCLRGGGIRP